MVTVRVHEGSLRVGRLELTRLAWALGISFALHGLGFGGYEFGKRLGIWEALRVPSWLQRTAAERARKSPPQEEVPLVFVNVNPQLATAEAPKNARFYSDKNSQAANPDASRDTDLPKITGTQTDVVKTEDVPRAPYDQLRPVFPTPQEERPEPAKPTSTAPPGDLAMARPDTKLRPDGTAEESRPRTIKEALLRQNRNQLVGEKMKHEGGVSRRLEMTSLDAKATPFGAYDAAFIEAVQARWYDLLDNISYDGYRHGKVALQFHLHYDGRVTDMKVLDNNTGEVLGLLCQKAVLDPAPYDKWPREMRLAVEKDYREIQFTFYYN